MQYSLTHILQVQPTKTLSAKNVPGNPPNVQSVLPSPNYLASSREIYQETDELPPNVQTRPRGSSIDGVGIVAILEKSSGPELLLQKQFRPPIDKVVIEIPAGLVDPGEGAAESAVRELREETGYHGVLSEMSPVMFHGEWYNRKAEPPRRRQS